MGEEEKREKKPRVLVDFLLQRMRDAAERSHWHSVKQALAGITEEEASWLPGTYVGFPFLDGSIKRIVYHLAADRLVHFNWAFLDKTLTYEACEHRFAEMGGNIHAAMELLEESHQVVAEQLQKLSDEDLWVKREMALGKQSIRTDKLFVSFIEHDLYHAGQINYIRALYKGRP